MPSLRSARHDRRAIVALFAVFALMVQAFMPVAAMASQPDAAGVICTTTGVHAVGPVGSPAGPHRGPAGMPCQDCLAAAMAAVVATPVVAVQPVAYEVARADHAPVVSLLAPRARAPPRPPGQGPPTA